jgi:two-component system invasion response regulator UvrY
MIHVMLVDDHELIRIALGKILGEAGDIKIVAEAGNGEEALEKARQVRPDVVILDVEMPGMGGIETTQRLSALPCKPKIIVISVHSQAPYPRRLLEAGALGYLPKGGKAEEVLAAVRLVARGRPYLAADIASDLALAGLRGASHSPLESLSKRELQIMMLLTQGHNPQMIAEALNISIKTVFTHRYRIYAKLGVDNDVALTHLAMRHGILQEG